MGSSRCASARLIEPRQLGPGSPQTICSGLVCSGPVLRAGTALFVLFGILSKAINRSFCLPQFDDERLALWTCHGLAMILNAHRRRAVIGL